MTGLYIVGGLIVFCVVALIIFKVKIEWSERAAIRAIKSRIDNTRIEEAAKADIPGEN
ncbi:hypothetical protein ACFLU1_00795 [Chloroflexota bacterium]